MKNFVLILVVTIIYLSVVKVLAQEELQIAFDNATFYFDDNETKWELYYSTPDNMFTYSNNENSQLFEGKIAIKFTIKTNAGVFLEDEWIISNYVTSTSELQQRYVFGTKTYLLPPGQYDFEIYAFDENKPERRVKYTHQKIISKFEKNRVNQSEIQFASYLEKISDSPLKLDHSYMKYDYYVVPNPRAEFFGNEAPLLGIYEIYNSDVFSHDGIIRSYKIMDNTGTIVHYEVDTCKIISENILTNFSIPLDTLPSGVYYFSATASYPIAKPVDSVTSTKKFFYYNQYKPPVVKRYFTENELFEKSEFNAMTPEQTDLEVAMAMVIAREEEIYQARSLTDAKGKQRFLFKFWNSRNTDSTLAWNETLRIFRQNVDFANRFFAYGKNREGWKTERGRVLLNYGVPTQRDMHVNTGEERAYEEWFYENVQGGVHFYFVDLSNIGNFALVHSTAMNEPYNPGWFDRYVPASPDKRIERELQNERSTTNPYGN